MHNSLALKFVAALLLISLLGVEFLIPINTARALDGGAGYELVFKEFVLDLIARIAAAVVVRALTNQIIGWIQGDGGKNVGLIGNLEAEFRRQIDARGGEFLNQLAGIDLCTADLNAALQLHLQIPGLRDKMECTLSEIGANAEDFFNNFEQGGLPAFIKITATPQNNPYGAYLIALDAKIRTESSVHQSEQATYTANTGYFGTRSYTPKCEALPEQLGGPAPEPDKYCGEGFITTAIEYNTKTPGGAVAGLLDKTFGSGIDWTILSDELSEAIVSIAMALTNQIFSSSYSGTFDAESSEGLQGGGGLTDPAMSNVLYIPTASDLKVHVAVVIDMALMQGQAALMTPIDECYKALIRESMGRLTELREQILATDDLELALPLYREATGEIRYLLAVINAAGLGSTLAGIASVEQAVEEVEEAVEELCLSVVVNVSVDSEGGSEGGSSSSSEEQCPEPAPDPPRESIEACINE